VDRRPSAAFNIIHQDIQTPIPIFYKRCQSVNIIGVTQIRIYYMVWGASLLKRRLHITKGIRPVMASEDKVYPLPGKVQANAPADAFDRPEHQRHFSFDVHSAQS
jgi:hypothetical protein